MSADESATPTEPAKTGFVSRMLLKVIGPAEVNAPDEDDLREQQAYQDGRPERGATEQ